ncbi:unnamed protein product [Ostreobium quekettii]|uniref:Sulfotransferase n=1 Tax=Ostreobium quekettii TaxID=121088 RepID=A0A8S1IX97_9CHLO|nr:unnamed protein product [Ostreobium quekettii]|eukprot:evm.model.scf_94.14 EVM.evm.TU.scf_94.14   scf_94:104917-109440(+)
MAMQVMKQRGRDYGGIPQDEMEQGLARVDSCKTAASTPESRPSLSPRLVERRSSEVSVSGASPSCLHSAWNCCFKPIFICKLRLSAACMLSAFMVAFVALHVLSQAATQSPNQHRLVLPKDPEAKFGEQAVSSLRKKPAVGVLATHHRTGTMLFSYTTGDVCQEFRLDFQLLEEAVSLSSPNETESRKYVALYDSHHRVMVGMHGYAEDCPEGPQPSYYCHDFDVDCWLSACSLNNQEETAQEDPHLPVVHVVRNPVDILVSSYLYHRRGTEQWLHEPNPAALSILPEDVQQKHSDSPLYKALQSLEVHHGLLVEFHSAADDIYRGVRNYRDLEGKAWALNVRYEDLQKDYDGAMGQVYSHLGLSHMYGQDELLRVARKFNLNKMPEEDRHKYEIDAHVTDREHTIRKSIKEKIENIGDLRITMERLANITGYGIGVFT